MKKKMLYKYRLFETLLKSYNKNIKYVINSCALF